MRKRGVFVSPSGVRSIWMRHDLANFKARLEAKLAAKDEIIASLQATLDHERKDREHERENWRVALGKSQANLLAAQDTPTARALVGAPKEAAIEIVPSPELKKQKSRLEKKAALSWGQNIIHNL